ncbi:MAG: heme exporter protein CcmD [Paracoccaceae bacterium]|nr:heme exporter protein CcmD [Paracoccaceae bacterium]
MPDLGKYADAVLSAYGVSILLLLVLVIFTLRKGRAAREALESVEKRINPDG